MSILIVEDNSLVAEALAASLKDQDYIVKGRAKTGLEAIEKAKMLQPDLVIMDINLKGDMDGIEASQLIKEQKQIPIIFLTAHSDRSTFDKAKATQPDAYITKPYNEEDLGRAIDLAIHNFNEKGSFPKSKDHTGQPVINDAIFVKSEKRYIKIPIEDLNYVEADGSYCKVHCSDKEYLLTMNLHNFETRIHHPNLMRISRSFIVNVKKVVSFEKDHLNVGSKSITISKQYQDDFRSRIMMA